MGEKIVTGVIGVEQSVHERSIAILTEADNEQMGKLVYDLACKHPSILCELADGATTCNLSPVEQVIQFMRLGEKVSAIKLWRSATGLGLKESKYFVDNLEY